MSEIGLIDSSRGKAEGGERLDSSGDSAVGAAKVQGPDRVSS